MEDGVRAKLSSLKYLVLIFLPNYRGSPSEHSAYSRGLPRTHLHSARDCLACAVPGICLHHPAVVNFAAKLITDVMIDAVELIFLLIPPAY